MQKGLVPWDLLVCSIEWLNNISTTTKRSTLVTNFSRWCNKAYKNRLTITKSNTLYFSNKVVNQTIRGTSRRRRRGNLKKIMDKLQRSKRPKRFKKTTNLPDLKANCWRYWIPKVSRPIQERSQGFSFPPSLKAISKMTNHPYDTLV